MKTSMRVCAAVFILSVAPAALALDGPIDAASFSGTASVRADANQDSSMFGLPAEGSLGVDTIFGSLATVDYTTTQTKARADFHFDMVNLQGDIFEDGSTSSISLTFETLVPAYFRLSGGTNAPTYSATFAGVTADRFPDSGAPGGIGGSIGAGGTFAHEGVLGRGVHTLSISAGSFVLQGVPLGGRSETWLTLTSVPTPGAAVALASVSGALLGRRSRRTTATVGSRPGWSG